MTARAKSAATPATLATALSYIARGWAVLPIRPRTKLPATTHGLKDATRDEATVRDWWTRWPSAGVGIATGQASGLVVLDVDGEAGRRSLTLLEEKIGVLPQTLRSKTGRGEHLFFALPGNGQARCSAGKLGDGLDVRGDGGYVVVAPSVHPNGGRYRWANDCLPAPLPSPLVKLLAESPRATVRRAGAATEKIPEGRRNAVLASLAGTMRRRGMGFNAIHAALEAENAARCDPPLPPAEVESIASSVTRYAPATDPHKSSEQGSEGVVLRPFSEIEPTPLRWFWPGRIPLGKLCLLIGDPGLGKSLLTLDIAARASRGIAFADGAACEPGEVVFLSAEDDAADTIRPRLDAAGADPSRIHLIEAVKVRLQDGTLSEKSFSLESDIDALESALAALPQPRLVVIDPISAYLGGTDSHTNAEVRGLLAPLAALAARRKIAVVAVSHLRKSAGSAVHRAIGSIAFAAAARSAWAVAIDPNDPDARLFLPLKQNLATDSGGLSFRIVPAGDVARIDWSTLPVRLRADDVLSSPESESDRAERRDARDFLLSQLEDGPVAVRDLQAAARGSGISWRAVETAKAKLAIRAERAGFGPRGRWRWSLPAAYTASPVGKDLRPMGVYEQAAESTAVSSATPPIDRIDTNATAYGGDGDLAEGEL